MRKRAAIGPENNRLVPVDNSLIFINFMNRLRAKRTDSLTNRFFSKYSNIGTLKNPPFSKKIYVIIRDPKIKDIFHGYCLKRQSLRGCLGTHFRNSLKIGRLDKINPLF